MAMNKKEQAEMLALQKEIELLKSWRLTSEVKPDVSRYEIESGTYVGFIYNTHTRAVSHAMTTSTRHMVRDRPITKEDWERSGSQNGVSLYFTKAKALKAMRRELELNYMGILAEVDRRILEAELEG